MMKKLLLFLLLTFLVSFWAKAYKTDSLSHVKGEVSINTKTYRYFVNLTWQYHPVDSSVKNVIFYLDKNIRIKNIISKDITSCKIDTTKDFQAINITFRKAITKTEATTIHFNYVGLLDSTIYKRYKIIELGLDWYWFPIHSSINKINFDYELVLKTDDTDLSFFNNGQIVAKGKKILIKSRQPDYDIDLFLFKGAKVHKIKEAGYDIELVGSLEKSKMIDSLTHSVYDVLKYYNSKFGINKPQTYVRGIVRPVPDSVRDLGYFRKGYFVIVQPDKASSIVGMVAHELSHYWWINGSLEDEEWLNESFAEYSALMAIRKLQGQERFLKYMDDKKKRVERTKEQAKQRGDVIPPVYKAGKKLQSRFTFIATYFKGPIILQELESEIGEEHFIHLLKTVADRRITTTEGFLLMLTEMEGQEISNKLLDRLKIY
jgi:hypothetical protein